MELFVMRHGEAEPYTGSQSDSQRQLTRFGRGQVATAAESLSARVPDLMLVSPFTRTQQTAEIVRQTLKKNIISFTSDWLRSETPVTDAIKGLGKALENALADDQAECILLVSHMPLVSLLTDYLSGQQVAFQPADIARIELEYLGREQGEFTWQHR